MQRTTTQRLIRPSTQICGPTALFLAAVGAILLTPQARAQDSDGTGSTTLPQTTMGVEEVVVTARKREENINEVPIAISAFSADDISKRNIESLVDVAKYTAGFSFENFAGGVTPAPIIRGLTQNTLTDRNQNVGTFVNGVHVQQQGNIDMNLMELERIEVLKGPQNSLYGRSSFAGAINYVPAKPDASEFDGMVKLTAGTDERYEGRASLNVPIIRDMLALRVYGAIDEFDGARDNNFAGGDNAVGVTDSLFGNSFDGSDGNLGGYDNDAYQIQLSFAPIDSISMNLSYYDSTVNAEQGAIQFVKPGSVDIYGLDKQTNCQDAGGRLLFYCGELDVDPDSITVDPRSVGLQSETELLNFEFGWDITDNLTFSYLGGWNDLKSNSYGHTSNPPNPEFEGCGFFGGDPPFDPLGGPCPPDFTGDTTPELLFQTGPSKQDADSHELRLSGSSDSFTWTAGYYYANIDDTISINSVETRRSLLQDPGGQTVVTSFGAPTTMFEDTDNAIFGAFGYNFLEIFTLDLEGRYAKEKRESSGSGLPAKNFYTFNPRVSLKAQVTDGTMVYGSIAEGSKAGGFNTDRADPGFETYDEETNTTYEIGSKWVSESGLLQVSGAVFYIDWEDLQLPTADLEPTVPGVNDPNFIANVSGASVWGAEFESSALFWDHWQVNLVASYTEAEFDNDALDFGIGAQCALSADPVCPSVTIDRAPLPPATASPIGGNQLPRQPKVQAGLGLGYLGSFSNWNYEIRGDLSYQSKQYLTTLNLGYIPERTLLDLNFTLTSDDGHWTGSLWGKNVTDEEYVSNSFVIAFANNYAATVAAGATYGITLNYSYGGR